MSARDQDRVTAASDAIDRELAVDASSKGQPLGTKFRCLAVSPLEVLFAVVETRREVHVLSVKRIDPPTNGSLPAGQQLP